MKGQKIAAIHTFYCGLFFLLIASTSCINARQDAQIEANEREAFNQAYTKAIYFEDRNPDSSKLFANQAYKLIQNLNFRSNDTLYSLLKLKCNILSQNNQIDSALRLLSAARLAEKTTHDKHFQAITALHQGFLEQISDQLELSEKHYLESIALLELIDDEALRADAYNKYGNLLMIKNDYNEALNFQIKAYEILDSLKITNELCSICMSIGNIFSAIGSKDEELRYTLLGLKVATMNHDTACELSLLNNLGVYYRHQNPDSARYYYQRILDIPMPDNPDKDLSARYNLANLYHDQKKYDEALQVYHEILVQCLHNKIFMGVASALSGIASTNSKKGNNAKAVEVCNLAIKYADSTGQKAVVNRLKNNLHIYYRNVGNFKDAYYTAMEIKAFSDSTQALEKKIALHELEIKYQSVKREAENQRLQLEVENQKQYSKSRTNIIILLVLIFLLSVFFSWKAYRLYHERSYAYNVLMKQYTDEKAQREIADNQQTDPSIADNSSISKAMDDPLIEKIIRYYEIEKPYLDPKLRVDEVAAKLNTSQKAIAAALKQYNNSTFNYFTNQYRIEEAKRIMENLSDGFYKVESVAYDSGFGSRSSFYLAFEQFTGIKPSYYRSFMHSRKVEIDQ